MVVRSFALKLAGCSFAAALGLWPALATAQSAGAGMGGAPSAGAGAGGAATAGAGNGGVSSGGGGAGGMDSGAGMTSMGGMSSGAGGMTAMGGAGQGGMTAMGGTGTASGGAGAGGMSSNLISNGTFDTASSPWWSYANDTEEFPADIALAVENGQLCGTMTAGGKNVWDEIIGYSGLTLTKGQYYHISFSASADADRTIKFKTGLGDAPYTDYFILSIPITATPQKFDYTYLNLRDDATAQFQFQIGKTPGKVCIDNVVVEPVAMPTVPAYTTPAPSHHPYKDYKSIVKMGTAVDTPIFLSNPLHNSIVAGEFAMITPANSMKMNLIQPVQGTFDYTDTDALVAWAKQNGLEFRGHPLVWHTQTPSWLTDGMFDKDALLAIMYAHIDGLMTHYAGQFPVWDVVNEAVDETTGTYRDTIWHRTLGDEFIAQAFQRAHMADPAAKLAYNDYNIEQKGNQKADFVYNMVADLKSKGVPIDIIGLQSHYFVEPDGTTSRGVPDMQAIKDNIARYADIGVEVHITECDFRIGKPLDDTKTNLQKKFFADLLQICIDAPNCSHFTVWGLSDLDSWVPSTFPDYDYAHIFDKALMPKPAYFSMSDVFAKYNTDGTLIGGMAGMGGIGGMAGAAGGPPATGAHPSPKKESDDGGCSIARETSGSATSLLALFATLGLVLGRRRAKAGRRTS